MELMFIEFLAPHRLWLLLLVPILAVVYIALLDRRRKGRGRHNALALVLPQPRGWVRHVAVVSALLSLVSLTVAFAMPKQDVKVPRERATIVVVIDVSLSMQAEDVEPNRLAAAQEGARAFVESLPDQYNVGLVAFAGSATTLVEPTTEHGRVLASINDLQLDRATAIGEGIYAALASLATVPPDPDDPDAVVPARIVLLSDGKTTVGRDPIVAAEDSKRQNVPVYTIAYGTENGYTEINGRRERVPVEYEELQRVADVSGGKAYRAATAGELKEVYEDIGSSVGYATESRQVTTRYAGLGLIFALVAAVGVASIAARWP
ncbi:VWA domain-containing protein [Enemella sp. A6]|uniref:VWA domain-containing protein n=1 Tax=Enemella sp. A6 TaxID=3440152 RepID=UPI003EC152E5